MSNIKIFDFSSENIYKLSKMVGNNLNKITPSYFSKICGTTGLIMFLLKDCMEYSGINIVEKKTSLQKIFNNLIYNTEVYNSKINRLSDYLEKYHNRPDI